MADANAPPAKKAKMADGATPVQKNLLKTVDDNAKQNSNAEGKLTFFFSLSNFLISVYPTEEPFSEYQKDRQ